MTMSPLDAPIQCLQYDTVEIGLSQKLASTMERGDSDMLPTAVAIKDKDVYGAVNHGSPTPILVAQKKNYSTSATFRMSKPLFIIAATVTVAIILASIGNLQRRKIRKLQNHIDHLETQVNILQLNLSQVVEDLHEHETFNSDLREGISFGFQKPIEQINSTIAQQEKITDLVHTETITSEENIVEEIQNDTENTSHQNENELLNDDYFVAEVNTMKYEIRKQSNEIDKLQDENKALAITNGALNRQIDELSVGLYQLARENDALSLNNNELNTTVQECTGLNSQLKNATSLVWELNIRLNMSNLEMEESVAELSVQNHDLNAEVRELRTRLDTLSVDLNTLVEENNKFVVLNKELNETALQYRERGDLLNNSLSHLNFLIDQLNLSNVALKGMITELTTQIDEYEALNTALNFSNMELSLINSELSTLIAFLNETADDTQYTFESVTSFLVTQIKANRRLLLNMVRNTYMQRIATWECDFRAYFRGEPFIDYGNIAIDDGITHDTSHGSYRLVMEYVENRVLSELCLDLPDFELYLELGTTNGIHGLTTNQLARGISIYTSNALDYYFSDDANLSRNQNSLKPEAWDEASYKCENLLAPFVWK